MTTDILMLFVLGTIGYMSPELMLAGYTGNGNDDSDDDESDDSDMMMKMMIMMININHRHHLIYLYISTYIARCTDVFACGVVVFILLSGMPPFQGNNEIGVDAA